MRSPLRLSLPVRLFAATALGAAGLTSASALWPEQQAAAPRIEAAFISPAAARALGARWRETRRPETGRDFAQALLAAGLSNELLRAVENDDLLAEDPLTRDLFEAEALLRLYRHDEALQVAATRGLADNPYAAFIRVRARAASGGGLDRQTLALATRGPAELAREAWLLRARAALNESDFATADASFRRAAEAGASTARLEPFKIERDIRAGKTMEAAAALAARARSLAATAVGRGDILPDFEGLRLAAMLAMRAGDGREAARLADRANLGTPGGPDAALAALAKWMAGDGAQAETILAAHLRAAPGDFIARDLAAALAFEFGKERIGQAHLAALERSHPGLGAFRRLKRAEYMGDLDAAYASLDGLYGEGPILGAGATLLGVGAAIARLPEPLEADRALGALGAAANQRAARAAVTALLDRRRSAVDLAAAAATLARVGALEEAAALAFDASSASPSFFAPVALRAAVLETAGRAAEALGHLDVFAARHRGHAGVRLSRARLLFRQGEIEASATAFSTVDPRLVFADDGAALDYARAAAAAGDPWREVMIAAAEAATPSPAQLARLLDAAGADAGAAEAYRDALVDHPDSTDLAGAYRAVMVRLGREAEADALLAVISRRRPLGAASAAANEPAIRENANL